jgi:hypothetical protein
MERGGRVIGACVDLGRIVLRFGDLNIEIRMNPF